jgi:hypothetical protein
MLVSNFEFGGGTPKYGGYPHAWDTRYQLQITNLENSGVGYTMTCDFAPVGGWPSGVDTGKEMKAYVSERIGWFSSYRRHGETVRGESEIWFGPGETGVVELASQVQDGSRLRGAIRLDAATDRTTSGRVVLRPFAVGVLLHARRTDYRGGYLRYLMDRNGIVTGRYTHPDSYSSESVHLSSGKAENTLETAGFMRNFDGRMLTPEWLSERLNLEERHGALLLPEDERPLALLDLLDAVDSEDEHIETLNEALSRLGSGVRVTRAEE